MDSLLVNRLRYSRCKCFRSITSFPVCDDGYRLATCESCKKRQRECYLEDTGHFIQERHERQLLRAKRAKLQAQKHGIWDPADLEEELAKAKAMREKQEAYLSLCYQLERDERQ